MQLPWHEIHTVLLDMDGTLLDLNFDSHFWLEHLPRRYAQSRGLDIPTAKKVLTPRFRRIEGTLDWYCLDYWTRELNLDVARLKEDITDLIGVRPQALAFLDTLRALGKRTVLVTNAHPKSLALKLQHTRLDDHLDRLICAHDLGLPKEEPPFWGQLQGLEPFTPAQTLLIDDNLHALRAAREFGIAHLLAIDSPSSQHPPKPSEEFYAIDQFADILPFQEEEP